MTKLAQTLVFCCAFVILGLASASFGPGIPSFAQAAGATLAHTGMIFVFHRLGYLSGSLGGGRIIDRISGNRLTGSVLLVMAAALAVLPFTRSLLTLFAAVLALGAAQGITEVGANTGVVRLHGDKAGPYMNGLHLSFCIGAIVSPLVISVSLHYAASIGPAFWLLGTLACAAGLCTLRLPAGISPRKAGKEEAAHSGEELSPAEKTSPAGPLLTAFFAVLMFFASAAETSFSGWVYSYALKTSLAGEAAAGIITSLFWGAMTAGRLLGVYIIRRIGSRRLLLASCTGAAVSLLPLIFAAGRPAGLWLSVILAGFFSAPLFPTAFTLAGERKILTGSVAGLLVASSSVGSMTIPPLIGRLMESRGPWIFPHIIILAQIMAFLVLLGILRLAGKKAVPS
ncbi:MAG: MFS transporter [Spirochaetales bacterium]|jgi:FHS family Na+ dependent glucose MFS transporter 1|nr:MFS transporter [Spirochaetales bacterium]